MARFGEILFKVRNITVADNRDERFEGNLHLFIARKLRKIVSGREPGVTCFYRVSYPGGQPVIAAQVKKI